MFITFEGIEGSGKSTAQKRLAAHMESKGYAVLCTREPGGSTLGKTLRAVLLDACHNNLHNMAEFFLFMADRAQHIHEVISPALEAGTVVLCDRYVDSTLAYQGQGRGIKHDQILQSNALAIGTLWPKLTLLFDLPVSVGLARANKRNIEQNLTVTEGRFDAESLDFHEKVRLAYLEQAAKETQRFVIIDATQPPEDVFLQCLTAIESKNILPMA